MDRAEEAEMAEVQALEADRLADERDTIAAERDGYRRVSEEAMKLMTDPQLLNLRRRLAELDSEAADGLPH